MSLNKFEIHFDEEKVKQYGQYSIDQLYQIMDILMERRSIDKLSEGIYQAKEDSDEYETIFMSFLMVLPKTDWFIKCADKWLYYYNDGVEDCLEEHRKFIEIEKNSKPDGEDAV